MSYGREHCVAADEDRRAELMEDEMADTLDQARELARDLKVARGGNLVDYLCRVNKLRSLILSDDLKREIENAAYEQARAATWKAIDPSQEGNFMLAARAADKAIRALVQPPAQKESWE